MHSHGLDLLASFRTLFALSNMNSMALELSSEAFYSSPSSVLDFPTRDYYGLSAHSDRPQAPVDSDEELIQQTQVSINNELESSSSLLSLDSDYSGKQVTGIDSTEVVACDVSMPTDVNESLQESAEPIVCDEQHQQLTTSAAVAARVDQPLSSIILLPTPQVPVVNCGGLQLTPQDIQQIQQQLQQRPLGQPMTATAPVNVNLSPQQYVIVGAVTPSMQQQCIIPQVCNTADAATVSQQSTTPTLQPILQASSTSKNEWGENLSPPTSKLTKGHVVQTPVARISEDLSQLEELRNFSKHFKQRRVELGYTQGDVGAALGTRFPNDFSQTTISRFEASNLSAPNMRKLMPLLQAWLHDQEQIRPKRISDTFANRAPPSPDPVSDSKRRKKRTTIEDSIKDALESSFLSNPKPNAKDLSRIAAEHNIERDVVRVWFCNRRQREKKLTSSCPPMQQISLHPNTVYNNPVQIIASENPSEPKKYVYTIGAAASKPSTKCDNEVGNSRQDENDKKAFSAALSSPQGATLKGYVKPIIFNSC